MTSFRPFFNPATGEWITYTALAEDSDGQLVRFTWRSVPGGVITEHIHPHQEERFAVLAGEAHFTLSGQELRGPSGRDDRRPSGRPALQRETPGNHTEVDGVVELRPALHTTRSGIRPWQAWWPTARPRPGARPKNPFQLGATMWHFRHESRVTSPPIWVQNLMLPPLWALAKAFGVRPYYDRWDSRVRGEVSG